jgi:hypothetical protein
VPIVSKPLDMSLLVQTIDDCIADARERRTEARVARERAARARSAAGAVRFEARALSARRVDLMAEALRLRNVAQM